MWYVSERAPPPMRRGLIRDAISKEPADTGIVRARSAPDEKGIETLMNSAAPSQRYHPRARSAPDEKGIETICRHRVPPLSFSERAPPPMRRGLRQPKPKRIPERLPS